MLIAKFKKQLARPTRSLAGWLTSKLFKVHNRMLEENAVQLSGIQAEDTVLELGHGPGLGLQSAAELLTQPKGHLIGVDYSEYMHQMASKQLKELVASGKVTLHLCDVAAMPLADSCVDKVFHCNCYYFWPDMRGAATEIHRVMKPGSTMVATLVLNRVEIIASQGGFPGENWRPENYMAALSNSGFVDVRMEEKKQGNISFQAIYATASK
ncbi:uncharacterized methyltransferase YdaC-like [Antennarius striatus]|uniref:uncharacterized methyltransferase YdaC-like n=1 Tax=Antennarius striatus TaxID=241820 RepID=UPI0035B00656